MFIPWKESYDKPRKIKKGKESKIVSHSVLSNCMQPHGLQSARLFCSWDFLDKSTAVGCHFLLQGIFQTQGSNLHLFMSPALADGFLITAPPEKPLEVTTNLTSTKTSQYIIIYLFILVLMDIWVVLVFDSYKQCIINILLVFLYIHINIHTYSHISVGCMPRSRISESWGMHKVSSVDTHSFCTVEPIYNLISCT